MSCVWFPRKFRAVTAATMCFLLISVGSRYGHAQQDDGTDPATITIHIVQQGETIETIATRYNTTAARIAQANSIGDTSALSVGMRLIIPQTTISVGSGAPEEFEIGLGDSLSLIAAQHRTTSVALAQSNRIANPEAIYVGQIIYIQRTGEDFESGWAPARLSAPESFIELAIRTNQSLISLAIVNSIDNPLLVMSGSVVMAPAFDGGKAVLSLTGIAAKLHPIPLEQGRTGGITVNDVEGSQTSGEFNGKPIEFIRDGRTKSAVVGIDRWTKPGVYPIKIQQTDSAGHVATLERRVLIINGNYQNEDIRLSAEEASALDNPQFIADESAYIAEKMGGFTPERYWHGLFQLPAAGVLTSTFGTTRLYNEENGVSSYHLGNDLAAQTGTPIYAPADGIVVDTGELTLRGLVTIIDHGGGVYTGYWHQSSILVRPRDEIKAGQQIGTIGNTGLSTASHLHWELWVGGVPVDSMQWVRELFP